MFKGLLNHRETVLAYTLLNYRISQVPLETADFHVTPNHTNCTKNFVGMWAICPYKVKVYIKTKISNKGVCKQLMLNAGRLWNPVTEINSLQSQKFLKLLGQKRNHFFPLEQVYRAPTWNLAKLKVNSYSPLIRSSFTEDGNNILPQLVQVMQVKYGDLLPRK